MSEEVKSVAVEATSAPIIPKPPVSEWECSVCGKDGGPEPGCELCGGNQRYRQTRSFTLTEEHQGLNPDANKGRYSRTGDVNPKIVVLPGGRNPLQG